MLCLLIQKEPQIYQQIKDTLCGIVIIINNATIYLCNVLKNETVDLLSSEANRYEDVNVFL